MENEIWKDIPGFEGYYQASSLSRIKSLKRTIDHKFNFGTGTYKKTYKEKIKNQFIAGGYFRVSLCVNNNERQYTAHRLVAQAFIPNPENKPQINHINGIKTDNRIKNLEWVTCSENIIHAHNNGLVTIKKGKDNYNFGRSGFLNKKTKPIINIKTGEITTAKQAAKESGYSFAHIWDMLNGVYKNKTNFKLL